MTTSAATNSMLDMYDDARAGYSLIADMIYLGVHVRVEAEPDRVHVWFAEDTRFENSFDVSEMKPTEFMKELDQWIYAVTGRN